MVLVSYKPINTIVLAGLIVLVIHFLQAARKRATLPGTEDSMTTLDFITALFYEVDEQLRAIPKHPEAHLWPSEIVTLGLLHALKGVGNRAFYRGLTRDYRALFPRLPERTRLFRLLKTHQDWTQAFWAVPTVLGVIDTYGIELIHPMREGRSPQQIGRKGVSNHRWIVGGKLCLLLNQYGLVVTNGVSLLQTNKYNSTCWPYCPGHTLPPSGSKTCHPARNGGLHDHPRFYYRLILRGR